VSIIRVGTTKTYSDGWEVAFGGKKAHGKTAVKSAKPAAKRSAKGKKSAKKK
jgi:hypothetical protein